MIVSIFSQLPTLLYITSTTKTKRLPKLGNLHFGTVTRPIIQTLKLITIQLYTPLVIASLFLLCHLHVRILTYVLLKVALQRA